MIGRGNVIPFFRSITRRITIEAFVNDMPMKIAMCAKGPIFLGSFVTSIGFKVRFLVAFTSNHKGHVIRRINSFGGVRRYDTLLLLFLNYEGKDLVYRWNGIKDQQLTSYLCK